MVPKIIYEDKNFLAIDKPAGLLVHPIQNKACPASLSEARELRIKKEPTLVEFLLKKYLEIRNVGDPLTDSGQANLRPGIVHRLDKDTSGVLLIPRNQKYFEYLKNLFQTRKIKKTYLALVWGEMKSKEGIIEKPIKLKTGSIKRTIWEGKDEKPAITEYKVLKILKGFSLLEVIPKTGRTHQIRVHLASIGHPVVGDKLYGFKKRKLPFSLDRQFLHAQSLEFPIEEGRMIKIEAELPEELKSFIQNLESKE